MQRTKRWLCTALVSGIMVLSGSFTAVHADGESQPPSSSPPPLYTVKTSDSAIEGKYGYDALLDGYGSDRVKSDNAPNMITFVEGELDDPKNVGKNPYTAFCVDVFNTTTAKTKYSKSVSLQAYLDEKSAIQTKFVKKGLNASDIAAIAYYGINEVPANQNDLYYTAAQFMIWDAIHEITGDAKYDIDDKYGDTGSKAFIQHDMSSHDKTILDNAKADIGQKVKAAKDKYTFDASVATSPDESIQAILMFPSRHRIPAPPDVRFQKFLEMDQNASVPSVNFEFIIEGVQPTEKKAGNYDLYAGNDSKRVEGTPAIGTASFLGNMETTDCLEEEKKDKKYASAEVKVDFSKVTFKETGAYRYKITEKPLTGETHGIETDKTVLYLDVFVNDEDGIYVDNTVLHTENMAEKPAGFTNIYETNDLTLAKKVSGNQASGKEYFRFDVSIMGLFPNKEYEVDVTNAPGSASHQNQTKLKADENGKLTGTFYLKSKDTITLKGLDQNAAYKINEDKTKAENTSYKASVEIAGDKKNKDNSDITMKDTDYSVADDALSENTTITYDNHKDGIVPTGIYLSVWPYAVMILAAGALLIMLARAAKKR